MSRIEPMMITASPEVAAFIEQHGVARIFMDQEVLGKAERQGHLDTHKAAHSLAEVAAVAAALRRAELMVRLNPLNRHTHEEIRGALDSGAQRLMLPMFTTRHDVALFLQLVAGEVPVTFLVETPQALVRMPDWLPLLTPGRDEVHIGLNDLSLGMGLNFLFEPLASRLLDPSAELLNAAGIAWGIGGVARVGQGELPAERVIGEHVRLGSRRVILSRAFHGGAASSSELLERLDFPAELAKLRQSEAAWRQADGDALLANQLELGRGAFRLAHKLAANAASPARSPVDEPAFVDKGHAASRERLARAQALNLPESVLFFPSAEPLLSPRWLAFWPIYQPAARQRGQGASAAGGAPTTEGHQRREFAREFARFADCEHALGVADFSTALELALSALGIGQAPAGRDEVIVSGLASRELLLGLERHGAVPMLADVEADSRQLSAATVAARLTPQTRAVVVTHEAGLPAEMAPLMGLARRKGIRVIEECSQAYGARYRGRSVGSLGHVACWSLGQESLMATGIDGGAVVTTRDSALHETMADRLGADGRISEARAAVARGQLGRLPARQVARQRHAERLWQVARGCSALRVPASPLYVSHAAGLATVFVDPERLKPGWDRDRILSEIVARGVACYSGVGAEPAWRAATAPFGDTLPAAGRAAETGLMFLCSPTLSEAEIDKTCRVLQDVMQQASR
ncbi:aldolase/citrate lyase family protein [Halomonas mongoliensis]|uniref:aldolase/citrate lyase family protein n=1 Tax=Halomonas mongoliensis TaxID=321265 RepID=UPI00403AC609